MCKKICACCGKTIEYIIQCDGCNRVYCSDACADIDEDHSHSSDSDNEKK